MNTRYSLNFLKNQQKEFLRLNKNIDKYCVGQRLNKIICFDPKDNCGTVFQFENIQEIAKKISNDFLVFLNKIPTFNLNRGRLYINLYTVCRCENFDLLFVFFFKTKKVRNTREKWIREYNVKNDRFCCINKFLSSDLRSAYIDQQSLENILKKLDLLCICPKRLINANVSANAYLLNYTDIKVRKYLNTTDLFFNIISDGIITPMFNQLRFSYGGSLPDSPDCSKMYQSLSNENIENFIFDLLLTALRFQNGLLESEKQTVIGNEILYFTIQSGG